MLIEKTNGFDEVTKLEGHLYKFTFSEKDPVYVYWEDPNESNTLTSLSGISYIIYEFTLSGSAAIQSVEIDEIQNYSFGPNPVLIEIK